VFESRRGEQGGGPGVAYATTHTLSDRTTRGVDDSTTLRLFYWISSALILLLLGILLVADIDWILANTLTVALWVVVALAADLLFVRVGKGLTLSMSLSVTLAAALLFPVAAAGAIAFLGCLDPMELRGGSSVSRAIFNRCQVALATSVAAIAFQLIDVEPTDWPIIAAVSLLALLTDFAVNATFVVPSIVLRDGKSPIAAVRLLFGSSPGASVALYISLGLMAPLIATVYLASGPWALPALLVPLALARGTLLRAERLHDVTERVAEKDEALRRSTESAGLERRDERMVVAGQLHDDVLPTLFKVSLVARVIKEDLDGGRLLDLDLDVPELLASIDAAQVGLRRLVGDLRRSSLGPGGLASTLRLLVDDLQTSGASPVRLDIEEVQGSDEALLVLYQVAKEALTNAAKYSHSREIVVRAWSEGGNGCLLVIDTGVGFELLRVDQRDHFGLQLMKERVESRGGRLIVETRLGRGTTIAATVPLTLPDDRRDSE
jgi:signal transduction histidine kinase